MTSCPRAAGGPSSSRSPHRPRRRSIAATSLLVIAALLLGGCGGDDDSTDPADDTQAEVTPPGDDGAGDGGEDGGGAIVGTYTLPDGTELEVEVTSCKTATNDSASFLVDDGFEVDGLLDDGATDLYVRNLGPDFGGAGASLYSDYDEERTDSRVSLNATDPDYELDGTTITVSGVWNGGVIVSDDPDNPYLSDDPFTFTVTC